MPVIIEEKGPYARAMRTGETLHIAREGSRVLFEAAEGENTRVMPMLGVQLEFVQPAAYENAIGTGHCLPLRSKICTYCHVWISSVNGETKPALMFKDGTVLLLEQLLAGQELLVHSI